MHNNNVERPKESEPSLQLTLAVGFVPKGIEEGGKTRNEVITAKCRVNKY